jgi:hypothetical protein
MTIRASRPQSSFDSSAGLFAVFRALHRLLAPRHPPHALSSLAALIPPSARDESRDEAASASKVPARGLRPGRVTILLSLGLMLRDHETGPRPKPRPRPRTRCVLIATLPLPCFQRTEEFQKNSRAFTKLRCRSPVKDSCFIAPRRCAARGCHVFSPPGPGAAVTTSVPGPCATGWAGAENGTGVSSTWVRPWMGMPMRFRPRPVS